MAKRKGKRAGQQNMPKRKNNGGGARANNTTGVRTVNVSVVARELLAVDDVTVYSVHIQGSNFPGLAAQLEHAIEWRIRSARVSFASVDTMAGYSIAAYLAPVGAAWKPNDWVHIETSGGVIKPVKNSGWSTNNLGSQDGWTNHANAAATFYAASIGGKSPANKVGVLTLHATLQLRGNR